mmetsp:Transcript_34725/g.87867  ORF Transcript_34725/g.87867 Transcript_34725/m.87867 type:complete len:256 (-) Transcript_34725:520-1287(-)
MMLQDVPALADSAIAPAMLHADCFAVTATTAQLCHTQHCYTTLCTHDQLCGAGCVAACSALIACRSLSLSSPPPRTTAKMPAHTNHIMPARMRAGRLGCSQRASPPSMAATNPAEAIAAAPADVASRPTASMPASSAGPPRVNTNSEPRDPLPMRTRSSKYVVARTTSLSRPMRKCSGPKLSTGGSNSTFTVSPVSPTGSTCPRRPMYPLSTPSSLNATLLVATSGLSTDWNRPVVRKRVRPSDERKRPPEGCPF